MSTRLGGAAGRFRRDDGGSQPRRSRVWGRTEGAGAGGGAGGNRGQGRNTGGSGNERRRHFVARDGRRARRRPVCPGPSRSPLPTRPAPPRAAPRTRATRTPGGRKNRQFANRPCPPRLQGAMPGRGLLRCAGVLPARLHRAERRHEGRGGRASPPTPRRAQTHGRLSQIYDPHTDDTLIERKNSTGGQAPRTPQRGKEVKIHGVSVRATRKPTLSLRFPVSLLPRIAARRPPGALTQEPPRRTRLEQ